MMLNRWPILSGVASKKVGTQCLPLCHPRGGNVDYDSRSPGFKLIGKCDSVVVIKQMERKQGVGVIWVGSIGRKHRGKCPAGLQLALVQVKTKLARMLKRAQPQIQRLGATSTVFPILFSYQANSTSFLYSLLSQCSWAVLLVASPAGMRSSTIPAWGGRGWGRYLRLSYPLFSTPMDISHS